MVPSDRQEIRQRQEQERRKLEEEFRQLLTTKLEDQRLRMVEISERLGKFEGIVKQLTLDMAVVQLKAGVWGMIGGLVTILAAYLLKRMLG